MSLILSSTLSTERTNSSDVSKFIVLNDCLQELFQFSPVCGSPVVSHTQFCAGTLLTVNIICSKEHERQWRSQPSIAGMPAGNLMVSAAILFSGETYSKISHFAEILKLQFLSESTYYRIQDAYVFPVTNDAWKKHQQEILKSVIGPLSIIGDGRCDSPGYSPKYGTYAIIDQNTDKILDFQLVRVGEVANSVAMEKTGLERSLQYLLNEDLSIHQLATDRHPQITSFMQKHYPSVAHQYDIWHVSKGVSTKLAKQGKQKACQSLLPWIPSICNHLWWCASFCHGNREILKEKWMSILHHISDVHTWASANHFLECAHRQLSEKDKARSA